MNTCIEVGDLAEEAAHSLHERIAMFAMAINGCSAQHVSQSDWEPTQWELMSEPETGPN
ncbi:MAG: hypothetical protein NT154_20145 [Verrucomicrobia bacterium]|nr:hypothetical protein [Verrucomicrobiota bacterium]